MENATRGLRETLEIAIDRSGQRAVEKKDGAFGKIERAIDPLRATLEKRRIPHGLNRISHGQNHISHAPDHTLHDQNPISHDPNHISHGLKCVAAVLKYIAHGLKKRRTRPKIPRTRPCDDRTWENASCRAVREASWSSRRSRRGRAAVKFMGCDNDGDSRENRQAKFLLFSFWLPCLIHQPLHHSSRFGLPEEITICMVEPCPPSSRLRPEADY